MVGSRRGGVLSFFLILFSCFLFELAFMARAGLVGFSFMSIISLLFFSFLLFLLFFFACQGMYF